MRLPNGPAAPSRPARVPEAELWFHAQPEKSQPIISALNINLDRWLISWPLLSERSLISSSQSTPHQQKNSKENTLAYLADSRRLSEVLEDDSIIARELEVSVLASVMCNINSSKSTINNSDGMENAHFASSILCLAQTGWYVLNCGSKREANDRKCITWEPKCLCCRVLGFHWVFMHVLLILFVTDVIWHVIFS